MNLLIKELLTTDKNLYIWIVLYLLVINILTFVLFAVDKWKAVHGKWRIRESTLLGLSFIGGALGGLAAMHLVRHKTHKPYFALGVPVMLFAQILVLVCLKVAAVF